MTSPTWQETCTKAQTHRTSTLASIYPPLPPLPFPLPPNVTSIPSLLLTPTELAITSLQSTALLHHLATRKLSSTAVTNAYLHRAALAQELTNCLTKLLPERALVRAQWLDDFMAEHGKPVGPLHGLMVSVKEHVAMEGLGCNAGFVEWAEEGGRAKEDALVLKILWEKGADF